MMFIQYVIWGAYVTITTYLTQTLNFTGTQAGLVFSTVSLASLVSPFFVGLIADRFFATERVMAFLYIVSAALLYHGHPDDDVLGRLLGDAGVLPGVLPDRRAHQFDHDAERQGPGPDFRRFASSARSASSSRSASSA